MSICHLKRELFLLPLFTRASQTVKVSSLSTPTPLASLLLTSYKIFPWKHLGNTIYFIDKANEEETLYFWRHLLLPLQRKAFFPWKHEGQSATLRDIFLLPLFTRAFQTAKVSSLSTPKPLASLLFTSYRIFPWKHLGNDLFIVK